MILELLQRGEIDKAYKILIKTRKQGIEDFKKEYNNDRTIRNGQVGKRVPKKDGQSVAKIPISFQKKIVRDAASFLLGKPVKLVAPKNTEDSKLLLKLWKKTRLNSHLLKFCKAVKSETEAAIVFFVKKIDDKNNTIKSRLLTSENGRLYPYFDEFDDMKAFGWEFNSIESDKSVKNLYIFTKETLHIYKQSVSEWELVEEKSHFFGKIPVVYHSQDKPEWDDVKELIDRFEMRFSRFCDTNDYFAAPLFKAVGQVGTSLQKDEDGKVVNIDIVETPNGNVIKGDAGYLTWDHAPESTKLEFETTKQLIYSLSSTPDLSMEAVKGIGQIANTGMKLMFLGPILKAVESEGDYEIVIERLINVLKAGLQNILQEGSKDLSNLELSIQFQSPLPENMKELIDMLIESTGNKPIMSQRSAIAINPLIENPDVESEQLSKEREEDNINDLGISAV